MSLELLETGSRGGAYVGMAGLLSLVIGGNLASEFITQKAVFAATQLTERCRAWIPEQWICWVLVFRLSQLFFRCILCICTCRVAATLKLSFVMFCWSFLLQFFWVWCCVSKLQETLSEALFPINLLLVLTTGGQLFTGNSATMAIGIYEKKCTTKDCFLRMGTSTSNHVWVSLKPGRIWELSQGCCTQALSAIIMRQQQKYPLGLCDRFYYQVAADVIPHCKRLFLFLFAPWRALCLNPPCLWYTQSFSWGCLV